MKLDINNIDIDNFSLDSNGIVILPCNYLDTDNYEYHSTAISFYKYASQKINIEYFTEPEILIDQRSGDWFGPLLLITSTAVTQNPELISITCGVISSYITDFFKENGSRNIKFKLIYKEVDDIKITEFSYEGSLDGLPYLENSINKIIDKGLSNEGVVSQINHQAATAPAPGDRYTRGFLTGRPRVFSLFMALTYAMTSPTWPL